MKKQIWMIPAAVLLLGVLLAVCLRQGGSAPSTAPLLPSAEAAQPADQAATGGTPADPAAPAQTDSDGTSQTATDFTQSAPAATAPMLPIDRNQDTAETEAHPKQPQTVEQSNSATAPEKEDPPSDGTHPLQAEPGEEPQTTAESGGQIVTPILPPDVFQ